MMLFPATIGKFEEAKHYESVDSIRQWAKTYFASDLEARPSLHRYIKHLPSEAVEHINVLRRSDAIRNKICEQFQVCNIIPLEDTDEFYISHYNMDKGGDQGLFDKHYDGNMRFIKNATVVRALIYISSNDNYVVHFEDSKVSHNFKTYEYGLLDFHRELHWVEGSFEPSDTPRMLLKCNYLVCEDCSHVYSYILQKLNEWIFYTVKACMEYSKSPKTPFQKFVGFICNFFRELNIIHPILPIIVTIVTLIVVSYMFYKLYKLITSMR